MKSKEEILNQLLLENKDWITQDEKSVCYSAMEAYASQRVIEMLEEIENHKRYGYTGLCEIISNKLTQLKNQSNG